MPWWIWILVGLVLLGVEIVTPGFFVFFFGVAALVVGAMVAFDVGGPEWAQWLLFSALSLVSMLVFRGRLVTWMRSQEPVSPVDTLQGEVATLLEDLSRGRSARRSCGEARGRCKTGISEPSRRGSAAECIGSRTSPSGFRPSRLKGARP